MKVKIKTTIRGCDAVPGKVYRYIDEDEPLLCFEPCPNHVKYLQIEDNTEKFAHFIRLSQKDPSSVILNKDDRIYPIGEPTIEI